MWILAMYLYDSFLHMHVDDETQLKHSSPSPPATQVLLPITSVFIAIFTDHLLYSLLKMDVVLQKLVHDLNLTC